VTLTHSIHTSPPAIGEIVAVPSLTAIDEIVVIIVEAIFLMEEIGNILDGLLFV